MRATRLAARCGELLGSVEGAVCSFLGERIDAAVRRERLAAMLAALPSGARIVVIDHNQPRALWRRALGAAVLGLRRLPPSRARHPVAREVRDAGCRIECVRFAAGERVQLVVGRKR